jgi:hypothetical protein
MLTTNRMATASLAEPAERGHRGVPDARQGRSSSDLLLLLTPMRHNVATGRGIYDLAGGVSLPDAGIDVTPDEGVARVGQASTCEIRPGQ